MVALVVFPLFILAAAAMEVLGTRRSRSRLQRWTADNHLRTQSVRRRLLPPGPWTWANARSSRFYEITVTDSQGGTRRGFARVSGGLGGVAADVIDVKWQP
jgi:hypothetical protein